MEKKITEFTIIVNGQGPILSGQCLSGTVIFGISKPLNMRSISIKLKGMGYCQWKETKHSQDGTQTAAFTGEESIIKQEEILFGKTTSTLQKRKHPAGRHIYPFSFNLPKMLPSSFSGDHGYIRYILKASIARPWKVNHKMRNVVTIYDAIDTNSTMYAKGEGGEQHKNFGFLCIKTGRLSLQACTDRSCYYPGESILINATVQNQTSMDMNSLRASLIQVITYKATKKKSLMSSKEIAEIHSPLIPREEEEKWVNKPLTVPISIPATTRNSKVIDIHYILKVSVGHIRGRDTEIKMSIIIGTIPYIQPVEEQFVPEQFRTITYPTCPDYPISPPSYSEVIAESGTNESFHNETLHQPPYYPIKSNGN